MELKQIDTLLLKILLLSTMGIVMTQTLGQVDLTSLLFLLTFPLTILFWVRSVRKTLTGSDMLMLMTVILASICVLLDLILSGGVLSFAYIRKLIMFIMTLLFLQAANRFRIKHDMVVFINHLVDFLTLFLIAMYFIDNRSMHLADGLLSRFLTFRFSNPNTAGMFLICLYMLELYRLFGYEKWYLKLFHVTMAGCLAWFTVETYSRNSLLVLCLYTAACLWLEFKNRRSLHITRFWATMIAWFPLIFVAAYMLLIYTPWIQNVFAFLVDVGKKLDSRMRIWTDAVNFILSSPLIGDYHGISEGSGVSQLHNTHLDVAASYGIPVLILVCILLSKHLHQKGKYYDDKESFSYILGFACAIMLGLGEAALFSGGLGIYIFVGIFLLLSNRKVEDEERA